MFDKPRIDRELPWVSYSLFLTITVTMVHFEEHRITLTTALALSAKTLDHRKPPSHVELLVGCPYLFGFRVIPLQGALSLPRPRTSLAVLSRQSVFTDTNLPSVFYRYVAVFADIVKRCWHEAWLLIIQFYLFLSRHAIPHGPTLWRNRL